MDMKAYFYHSRFEGHRKPRLTLCAVENDDGILNIGIARCSVKDNFSRKKGRTIAYGRAVKNPTGRLFCEKGSEVKAFISFCKSKEVELLKQDARMIIEEVKGGI